MMINTLNDMMIDTLVERIERLESPIVVGLDPTLEMMPETVRNAMFAEFGRTPQAVAGMFTAFNKRMIDSVADLVPAVKPQIAMYERYGLDGLVAYLETVDYAKSKGLIVIGDIKRGDIASTAEAYAAHLGGVEIEGAAFDLWQEDAITLNPYFGTEGIRPFTEICEKSGKAVFLLVKTSNAGSGELQDLVLSDGEPVYMKVARLVEGWGASLLGRHGFSSVCAVVGATHSEVGSLLRERFPAMFFLVPGYGAQGGTAADLRGFFDKQGRGCIVNSSRGIIAAWQKDVRFGPENIGDAAREATLKMREELRNRG
jgi:orotidine-5'-phosphate decarboxylase